MFYYYVTPRALNFSPRYYHKPQISHSLVLYLYLYITILKRYRARARAQVFNIHLIRGIMKECARQVASASAECESSLIGR